MSGTNNIDAGGRAYLPSLGTGVTAVAAGVGLATLGPLGLFAGGVVGYIGSSALGTTYRKTSFHLRSGGGAVIYGIKELFLAVKVKVCAAIFLLVSILPLWLIQSLQSTKSAKYAYAEADQAYLEKCRTTSYQDGRTMNLDTLFKPLKGGVSSDEDIIGALGMQALISQEGVSLAHVKHWVALGERLYAALSSEESTALPDGVMVVKDEKGQEIIVESSVYTARTLMWYFSAQAVRGEIAKQSVLLMGHYHPTPAEMQALVKDVMVHGKTLVIPDKGNRAFAFLTHAKTAYKDKANLLAQDSALVGGDNAVKYQSVTMKMHAVDDSSGYLPAGAKRIAINALLPVKGEKTGRLAIKLEDFSNPSIAGQATEGHESFTWRMLQMATGAAAQTAASVAYLKPEDETAVKSKLQIIKAQIYQEIAEGLELVKGEKYTPINKSNALNEIKEMPLYQLLPYLVHPEESLAKDDGLLVLSQIPGHYRDELKKMIYAALYEGLQAGERAQFERRGEEILLMPHMVGQAALRDYWRTQIGKLKDNLMIHLFKAAEARAVKNESEEYRVTKVARFVVGNNTPIQEMETRKKHESDLFDEAYEEEIRAAIEETEVRQQKAVSTPLPLPNTNGKNTEMDEDDDIFYDVPLTEEPDSPKVSVINPNWMLTLQDSYRAPVQLVKIKVDPNWQKKVIEDYVSLVAKVSKDQALASEQIDDLPDEDEDYDAVDELSDEDEYYDAVDDQPDEKIDNKPK